MPSERIFSKAGKIVTKTRSNLSSNSVRYLIFLSENFGYEFQKSFDEED